MHENFTNSFANLMQFLGLKPQTIFIPLPSLIIFVYEIICICSSFHLSCCCLILKEYISILNRPLVLAKDDDFHKTTFFSRDHLVGVFPLGNIINEKSYSKLRMKLTSISSHQFGVQNYDSFSN